MDLFDFLKLRKKQGFYAGGNGAYIETAVKEGKGANLCLAHDEKLTGFTGAFYFQVYHDR